jgi:hypothetical protein
VYINRYYEIKQIESFHGDSALAVEELDEGTRIPVCEKEIQPMSVQLGMVTQEEYRILQLCDGDHTVETISEIVSIPLKELEEKVDSLRQKGIVKIIIRRT